MSEVHSAVGSYVINALDGAELVEFEEHLAVCETCSREVGEFSETVAELAMLAATPPPALRRTILAAIKEVRPLPPEIPTQPPADFAPFAGSTGDAVSTASGTGPERTGAGASDTTPSPAPRRAHEEPDTPYRGLAPVVDLSLRRARRRGRLLIVGIAAALVMAVGLGGWAYTAVQARDAQVSAAQQENLLESQLFSAPDVKVFATTTLNGGQISFVSSKSFNKALFVGTNLPPAGSGKRYQLWTLTPGAQSDVLFDGGASRKQWFTNSIADASGLAVTIEPAGGSPAPTGQILASAKI